MLISVVPTAIMVGYVLQMQMVGHNAYVLRSFLEQSVMEMPVMTSVLLEAHVIKQVSFMIHPAQQGILQTTFYRSRDITGSVALMVYQTSKQNNLSLEKLYLASCWLIDNEDIYIILDGFACELITLCRNIVIFHSTSMLDDVSMI